MPNTFDPGIDQVLRSQIRGDMNDLFEKRLGSMLGRWPEPMLQQLLQEQVHITTQLNSISRMLGTNDAPTCPLKGDLMPIEFPDSQLSAARFQDSQKNLPGKLGIEECKQEKSGVETCSTLETELPSEAKLKAKQHSVGSGIGGEASETITDAKIFKRRHRTWLYGVVSDFRFEIACAFVIIINTGYIGFTTNDDAEYALTHVGTGARDLSKYKLGLELFFLILYTLEFMMRFACYHHKLFVGPDGIWKVFDFLLVLIGWVGVFDIGPGSSIMWMRAFKAVNAMMRALRVLRVVNIFREIRVLITSVASALRSLIWIIMAQILLMYMFALLLVNGVSTYLLNTPDKDIPSDIHKNAEQYWGSLGRGMLTLLS
jgi:hypothetical protein